MMESFGGRAAWQPLITHLEELGDVARRRAKALLVISAHWEERVPTVHFGKAPGMFYDYYGFPEETYHLTWPAPGSPEVARRVDELLRGAGFETGTRGGARLRPRHLRAHDGGASRRRRSPWRSSRWSRDSTRPTHLAIGRALAPLRDEGVLIVGSGFSYHNLRMFGNPRARVPSERFDEWLRAAAESPDPADRDRLLAAWESAPDARACHPRSEHLVPIFIAAGAGGTEPGRRVFSGTVMGVATSGFAFGGQA